MHNDSWSLRLARKLDLVGSQGIPADQQGLPQRNAPSPLRVFWPWIRARSLRRSRRLAESKPVFELPPALDELIAHRLALQLPANGRWHDTGIDLHAGEELTLLATGRLFLSRPLEVSIGAGTCLWYRLGQGPIMRLPRESAQINASQSGRLYVQAALPGAFDTPQGEINPETPPPALQGALQLCLIRWSLPANQALPRAAEQAPALFDALWREVQAPTRPPHGWQYFWRLGEAAIFHRCEEEQALCCNTRGDVGILQYPVDLSLDESLQLTWSWLTESLPSALPEHIQPTHDYLSIAVEFDNGLDLTYMWSAALAPDTIFQCPLPWWDQRETHWVLRSNPAELGQWLHEQRPLAQDYRRAIGGPLPTRVRAVWLIANSAFQNGRGRCRYRDIELLNQGVRHVVPC